MGQNIKTPIFIKHILYKKTPTIVVVSIMGNGITVLNLHLFHTISYTDFSGRMSLLPFRFLDELPSGFPIHRQFLHFAQCSCPFHFISSILFFSLFLLSICKVFGASLCVFTINVRKDLSKQARKYFRCQKSFTRI